MKASATIDMPLSVGQTDSLLATLNMTQTLLWWIQTLLHLNHTVTVQLHKNLFSKNTVISHRGEPPLLQKKVILPGN